MGTARVRKALLTCIGVVVALILVAVLLVMFQLGAVIKTAVVKVGPTFTGGPIELESVTIRPITGKATLKGLVVGNPEGFTTPSAFELAELRLDLNVWSVFTGKLAIHEVIIDGPRITYEQSNRKSNIDTIMANVEKKSLRSKPAAKRPPPDPTTPKPKKEEKPEQLVVIDRLVVSNGEVNYSPGVLKGKAMTLPLPTITLTDIGKQDDTTVSEAIALVAGEIINGVGTALVQSFRRVGRGLQTSGNRLTELARDNEDIADDAANGIGRAADDVRGVAHKGLKKLGLGELIGKPANKED